MLKVFRIILMFCLLLAALSACGTSNEVKLEAGDDGSQVELKAGQTLVVSLEGNPTTGYTWEAAELDEQVLRQVGEAEFKPDSDAIGAGGVHAPGRKTWNLRRPSPSRWSCADILAGLEASSELELAG
jgi:inhibitor of cysteine peptidase